MPDGVPGGMPDDGPRNPGAPRGRLRRTPCVGVCSTTYGDLVCRGCKRFAHEIVAWNGYRDHQRDVVWARLNRLLADSVRAFVVVIDEHRLRSVAHTRRLPEADSLPAEVVAFRTMHAGPLPLSALGLAFRATVPAPADSAAATREAAHRIDREFYTRSRAYYEASFKTLT